MITCTVEGATDEAQAERIAKSVISSTLTKAAIFGARRQLGPGPLCNGLFRRGL